MTTIKQRIGFKSFLLPTFLMFISAASAQQAVEPPVTDVQPPNLPIVTDPTVPQTPTAPAQPASEPIPWNYERTRANQAGTVSSTHRYRSSEDGGQTYREHVVTNPRREMLQSWERNVSEDGYTYRRQHIWTNPDGTPLRSHQWTTTGTDENNYQRSRTMVLRDGRTISKTDTRTWDGTQGTRERTMIGPNGQTRTFERAWTPDGVATDGPVTNGPSIQGPAPASLTAPVQRTPLEVAAKPQPKRSFWSKLNPFAKKTRTDISTTATPKTAMPTASTPTASSSATSSSAARRGFTVGSRGRSFAIAKSSGITDRNPGHSQGVARGRSIEHRRIQAKNKLSKTSPGRSGKLR